AARHAQRVGGNRADRIGDLPEPPASWRWRPGSATVELSPALARKAGLGEEDGRRIPLLELFRRLDADGRRTARVAVDRLLTTGESTVFAHHDSEGGARLAHHLRVSEQGREVIGRTETIPSGNVAAFQSRDPLTGVRDGRAARGWIDDRLTGAGSGELVV